MSKKNRNDINIENQTSENNMSKSKRGKRLKRLLGIFGVIAALYFIMIVANIICNVSLRKYINSFDVVEYGEDRLVPVKEDGYYCFKTDCDIDIMHITDIHIGGGFWSYKNDKKSIYELITMLKAQKPDFVILGGDNTYCVPAIGYNGGNTGNNRMTARTLIEVFEHEQVYFTTIFGNHDTESFDYADRDEIGELYMKGDYKYCFFEQNFSDRDAETVPSVSNQFVLIKNTSGDITKVILLLDTNAYVDTLFMSTIMGRYDTIHASQTQWAKETIADLSKKAGLPDGEYLKCLVFMHIPFGEYRSALDDLIEEVTDADGNITFVSKEPENTVYIEGSWGEEKVCYGGLNNPGAPDKQDDFFEVMADELHSMEAAFCGHDHVNNAVVLYKGVMLCYGYSVDNEAYGNDIRYVGSQRGATVVTVSPDGSFSQQHKNAYLDYGCSTDEFVEVDPLGNLYPEWFRKP